ncbi:Uncharacterised protein [uncultured archaeon]|nr:Uncharacterised protein [uncultured archaeon]
MADGTRQYSLNKVLLLSSFLLFAALLIGQTSSTFGFFMTQPNPSALPQAITTTSIQNRLPTTTQPPAAISQPATQQPQTASPTSTATPLAPTSSGGYFPNIIGLCTDNCPNGVTIECDADTFCPQYPACASITPPNDCISHLKASTCTNLGFTSGWTQPWAYINNFDCADWVLTNPPYSTASVATKIEECCIWIHENGHQCPHPRDNICHEMLNEGGPQKKCLEEAAKTICASGTRLSDCTQLCGALYTLKVWQVKDSCRCRRKNSSPNGAITGKDCCDCYDECVDKITAYQPPPYCTGFVPAPTISDAKASCAYEGPSHNCNYFGGPPNFDANICHPAASGDWKFAGGWAGETTFDFCGSLKAVACTSNPAAWVDGSTFSGSTGGCSQQKVKEVSDFTCKVDPVGLGGPVGGIYNFVSASATCKCETPIS